MIRTFEATGIAMPTGSGPRRRRSAWLKKGVCPMNPRRYFPIVFLLGMIAMHPFSTSAEDTMKSKQLPPIPLSVEEIHAWIDRAHPLLRGASAEKTMARGKMLKALGTFEPNLVNDTELERFISISDPGRGTQTVGFNDTLVEARHPLGFRYSAGVRQAIGDAKIPDLSFGGGNNQMEASSHCSGVS
jgi:hypothetical protein